VQEEEEKEGKKMMAEPSTDKQQACKSPAHADGLREIRAMIIAALPCPPMPIMVCRELAGECRWVFYKCTLLMARRPGYQLRWISWYKLYTYSISWMSRG
jgi:hypothetical protein